MVKFLLPLKYFGLFFLLCTLQISVLAVDRTFVPVIGVWNQASNWSPSGVPAGGDNVTIPNGRTCNLDIVATRSGNVTIANGGKLKLNQNYNQTGGAINIIGSGIFEIKGFQVTFSNGCNVTGVLTTDEFTNISFLNCPSGTISPQVSSPINNLAFGSLSTVDLGSNIISMGTITVGSGNTLNVGSYKLGINARSGSGVINFSPGPSGSTIEYVGSGPLAVATHSVKSMIFNRNGLVTLSGTITLASQLVISNVTTIQGSGLVSIVPFAGSSINFTNNGTFSLSTGGSSFTTGPSSVFINNNIINQVGTLAVTGSFENHGDFNFSGGHSVTINGTLFNSTTGKFNQAGANPSLTVSIGPSGQFINQGLFKTGTTSSITISSDLSNGFQNAVTGNLDLASTLTFSNGNTGINNLGTIQFNPGVFAFTGTGSPVIYLPKNLTYSTIQVSKTGGSLSLSGPGKLIIVGSINVTTGTFDLGGKSVILKSGPTGTGRIGPLGGTLAGSNNITMERYVSSPNQGWYFIGTPILGQTFANWTDNFSISGPFPGASLNTSPDRSTVYVYDGAAPPTGPSPGEVNGWRVPSTGVVSNGLGYRVFLRTSFTNGSKTYDNTGDIVKGNFNFPVTFNTQGYGGGGWNFLANPYPSQIDWNAGGWTKTNIGGTIYVWNGQTNQYGAYNFANDPPGTNPGTNGVSNIIASGQAFFIRATAASPVLQATENVKSSGTNNFIRSAVNESSYFRITLSNPAGYKDENVIRFFENSTTEFDSEYDAYKMTGSVMNLSTTTPAGNRLCINTMPRLSDDIFIIPMNATAYNDNQLTLTFSEFGSDAQGLNILLKDKYLNTLTVIQEGSTYKFSTNADPASKGDGRFELMLTKAKTFPSRLEGLVANILPYSDPGSSGRLYVKILNPKPELGTLRLVDVMGKLVYEQTINPLSEVDFGFPCQLAPGMYVVEFSQPGINLRTKTLIRD